MEASNTFKVYIEHRGTMRHVFATEVTQETLKREGARATLADLSGDAVSSAVIGWATDGAVIRIAPVE